MNSCAIIQFGKMLTRSRYICTVGVGGPIFAWAAPGDIVICGEAPEDFHRRVCSVKFPDEENTLFCRLYKDGESVRVGYMDDYDIWKSYPANAVTIQYEVLAVVHQYGPMEPPKAETAWEKRVKQGDGAAIILSDILPDASADQALNDVENRVWLEQLRKALDAALDELPDNLAETLRHSYYMEQTPEQAIAALGTSRRTFFRWKKTALQTLRRRQELRQFLQD